MFLLSLGRFLSPVFYTVSRKCLGKAKQAKEWGVSFLTNDTLFLLLKLEGFSDAGSSAENHEGHHS